MDDQKKLTKWEQINALELGIGALKCQIDRLEWEAERDREAATTLVESEEDSEALEAGVEALYGRAFDLKRSAKRDEDALKVFQAKLEALQNGNAPQAEPARLNVVKNEIEPAQGPLDIDEIDLNSFLDESGDEDGEDEGGEGQILH